MSDTVIRVENLSKLYKLGLIHHDRLAEAITAGLKRTSTTLRRIFSGNFTDNVIPSSSQSSSSNTMPSSLSAIPSSSSDTIWALRDVSFEVKRGEVLGIIGRNGAGKTTLLKILTGITEPTEGRVWMKGRVASLLEVGTGFHPELTGRENIFLNGAILGMTRVEIKQKFDEIVEFAEIEKFIDTPVKRYSSGMYVRLAFAVAAHLEPEILLVDEVLAVGDIAFQKKCLGKMDDVTKGGRTILFVSHNMSAISQLAERCLVLDWGRLDFLGATGNAIEQYIDAQTETSSTGRKHIDQLFFEKRVQLDPRISIIKLGFSEDHGTEIAVGGSLCVEVFLETDKAYSNLRFGYSVNDDLGRGVLGGFSPTFEILTNGDHLLELRIPRLFLAPGSYSLSISVQTGGLGEPKYIFDIVLKFGRFIVKHYFEDSTHIGEWHRAWGHIVHTDSYTVDKNS